jgi:uncharacterized protein (DUF488 family)
MPITVYTIGYERHADPNSLIVCLADAGVERLVDVRELPLSRRRGFSKNGLAAALAAAGISYEHARPLGNPKPYRQMYKGGDILAGRRAYRRHLNNGSFTAFTTLASSLDGAVTCLLCVEDDYGRCHRAVIIEALLERQPELNVVHL